MSISETQVSNAPFIAFHARFGASNAFFEKDQEIYSEYEPAHSKSLGEPSEATRASLMAAGRFAHSTCRAMSLGWRTVRVTDSRLRPLLTQMLA
jgi:hypothetical protein